MKTDFESNIHRKKYSPVELEAALNQNLGRGQLKQIAEETGMSYNTMRHFKSTMARLSEGLKHKVVWSKPGRQKKRKGQEAQTGSPTGGIGSSGNTSRIITYRQARLLAQLGQDAQKTLYEANLPSAGLKMAVKMVRDEKVGAVEAVNRARMRCLQPSQKSRTAAAFLMTFAIACQAYGTYKDLVRMGFSKTTAWRTEKELEQSGLIKNGLVSNAAWKTVSEYAKGRLNIHGLKSLFNVYPLEELQEGMFRDLVKCLHDARERRQSIGDAFLSGGNCVSIVFPMRRN